MKNVNYFVFQCFNYGSPAFGVRRLLIVCRVSPGRIIVGLFWTKYIYAVPRQIKPGIVKLTTSRGQSNLRTVFSFVSCEEMRQLRPSRRESARTYRLEQRIAVKFRFVFRYKTVVFRRYVLALLLVGLLRKFEAYLVYLSLIGGKIPRRFSCFQIHARISDMRNRFSALSGQLSFDCRSYCGRSRRKQEDEG